MEGGAHFTLIVGLDPDEDRIGIARFQCRTRRGDDRAIKAVAMCARRSWDQGDREENASES